MFDYDDFELMLWFVIVLPPTEKVFMKERKRTTLLCYKSKYKKERENFNLSTSPALY